MQNLTKNYYWKFIQLKIVGSFEFSICIQIKILSSMCEYRNWEVIYAMNHQLDEMLAYMGCINPKSITQSEQSELLRRASTKDDNGYIWSIFAYCVFDFYNFDPPFGIISLLQYNQNN